MTQVKVVRRWGPRPHSLIGRYAGDGSPSADQSLTPLDTFYAGPVVAIGTSTGGPAALRRILIDLPGDFAAPILVVQHIAKGFLGGLASWLNSSCRLHVKVAGDAEPLESRTVYLAPDDRHLGVRRDGRTLLSDAPPIGGFRPSATFLFESVARAYGANAIGIILTGMGSDGVAGLRELHAAGGLVLAQDEASSVVYGMAQEAVQAGVADDVIPLERIASRLVELASAP